MPRVHATLHVDADGRVTGRVPPDVPPGDYVAPLDVPDAGPPQRPKGRRRFDWPAHDCGPWPAGLSLRREDMYGDDGR
ncbi:MAG TPA: hypothetical protein VFG43_16470 [Geminicoccaceae bacterium]|nr:hypothetical protein [Geminicoccaceae bacterium]